VFDTSALMQGVFFTEFDWHELHPSLKASAVRLVVLSLVTEELDEIKHRGNQRQKARARKVLTELDSCRLLSGSPGPGSSAGPQPACNHHPRSEKHSTTS